MTIYAKYPAVILPAKVKFVPGPLAGVALHPSWWQTLLCSIMGMMISVLVFTFLGKAMWSTWQKSSRTPSTRFSKQTRRAVSLYQKFGIAGAACLSPLFLTPVGGTLITTSFKEPPVKIILWMSVFAFFGGGNVPGHISYSRLTEIVIINRASSKT